MSDKIEIDSCVYCPEWDAQLKHGNFKDHMEFVHNKKMDEKNTKYLKSDFKKIPKNKTKKVISKPFLVVLSIIFIIIIATFFIFYSLILKDSNFPISKKQYFVSIDGTGDFSSIQGAINFASINDTIFVGKGTYYENIKIKKSIELIGEDKNTTIINGNGSGIVINISADYVKINNFTITNGGSISGLEPDAGVRIESNYSIISNCNISSNKNYGIYLNANPSNSNNYIKFNTFFDNKYGIYSYYAEINNISSNIFLSNSEYGIYLGTKSNDNLISKNIFEENKYAIRIKTSNNNILINNTIINNLNGIYFCCGSENNIVYNNILINNTNWNANDALGNIWDNGTVGNYWDDYNGTDANGDGIGDTPYLNNIKRGDGDRFPIMKQN